MMNITPPPALHGDEQAKLTQIYRYLFRLSESLNATAATIDSQAVKASEAVAKAAGIDPATVSADVGGQYTALVSLVVKTANIVQSQMDKIVTTLNSKYKASGEFGELTEEVRREIEETAKHTIENFQYGSEVLNIPEMAADFEAYKIETEGYIKRGIIDYDKDGFPVFGIAIGQELKSREVTIDGVVHTEFDTTKNMATYTADKLSFWIDGVEVAYLSQSELVVTRIIVSDSIQLGDWDIKVNAQDGLTIQQRIGNEIVTASQINMVADQIDLSGNKSIKLTAEQINAVADEIDLSGNKTIKLTAEQINAVAGQIDLTSNKSITMLAGEVDELDRLSNIEVIEGTFAQTERREGEGIRIYSEIGPKQDLTNGEPSPDNICPIEGWTGLDAFAGGKNLCPFDEYTTPSSGNYSTEYMASPALKPGESVMIYGQTTDGVVLNSGNCQLVFTGAAGTAGDEVWMPNPSTQPQIVPSGYINAVQFRVYTTSALAGKTIRMMIEVGSATEWVPYQGNTYALDFGETVYGGKVDWHAGEMTVNRKFSTLSTDNIVLSHNNYEKTCGIFVVAYSALKTSNGTLGNVVCTHCGTETANSQYLKNIDCVAINDLGRVCITFKDVLTVEAAKARIEAEKAAGTPIQICYELAEPYTIQLTPVQIETLQGINTVYTDADGGRVEFGYSHIEDIQNAVDALEEAQAESALYLKLDAENKVVRIGQTEVTSEFDIDAYGAGVVVGGKSFSRLEGERVLIGGMEMRKPANIGGLAFDSIMT